MVFLLFDNTLRTTRMAAGIKYGFPKKKYEFLPISKTIKCHNWL